MGETGRQGVKFVVALAVIICAIAATVTATPQQPVLTFKDIKPILNKRCVSCHGDSYPSSNLTLKSYEGLTKGGKKGKAVVAGNAQGSLMMKMIKGTVQPRMPLDAQPLSQIEIEKISKWIQQGAKK
jgi:hypothetical protein